MEGTAYCDEHDIGTYGICLRGERTGTLEKTGRWEESAALSGNPDARRRLTGQPDESATTWARSGPAGAGSSWEYLDEASGDADEYRRTTVARARPAGQRRGVLAGGRAADARREAERADEACDSDDAWDRGAVAAWLRRTGSSRPPRGEVAEPYRQQLQGTGRRPPSCGPAWAARTRPRWSG